jgi:hypothetical protein
MQVTGYQLREALRRWELRRKAAEAQFRDSIYAFKDDEKTLPVRASDELALCEDACAILQVTQQRYNQLVFVGDSPRRSLAYCVKTIGAMGRHEKLWREATIDQKDRYERRESRQRNADAEYATRQVTVKIALDMADKFSILAAKMRAGIAVANGEAISIERLDLTEADYTTFVAM